ncbi:MAG: hypothetical protein ACRD2U_05495 [Terriglobales bacterium]
MRWVTLLTICALGSLLPTALPSAGQNTEASPKQAPVASPSSPSKTDSKAPPSTSSATGQTTTTVHKKRRRKKSHSGTSKVVVKNGSAPDPTVQFSTATSPDQASHERQKTDGLLATTNANIQKLSGHPLNANQQDMLKQVRAYMDQAKSAEATGDFQSAQNLALKAQLLSLELAKRSR